MDAPRGMVFNRTNCKDVFWLHANRRDLRAWGVDFNLSLAEGRDHSVKVSVINNGIEKMTQYKLNELLSRPLHCGRHAGDCACPLSEDPNPPAGYDEDRVVATMDSDVDEGSTFECGASYYFVKKTSPFLPITPKACFHQAVFLPLGSAAIFDDLDTPWGLWEKLFRLGQWRVWNVQYDLTPGLASTHEVILGKPGEPLEKMSQSAFLKLIRSTPHVNDCAEADHGSCAFTVAPQMPKDYDPCKPARFEAGDRPFLCSKAIDRRPTVTPSMRSEASSKRDGGDVEERPAKRPEVMMSQWLDDRRTACGLDEHGIGNWLSAKVRPSELLEAIARNEAKLTALDAELIPTADRVIEKVTEINDLKSEISEGKIRIEEIEQSMTKMAKSIRKKETACSGDDEIPLVAVLEELRVLREEHGSFFAEKCFLERKIRKDEIMMEGLHGDCEILNAKREELSKERVAFAKREQMARDHDDLCIKAREAFELAAKSKDAFLMGRE